jgi:hypothetical protein
VAWNAAVGISLDTATRDIPGTRQFPGHRAINLTVLLFCNDTVASPDVPSSGYYVARERSVEINGELKLLVQDSYLL